MIKHTTVVRVRYADTDKMQFVYNGKYLEYFEVGRTELLRHYGLAYNEIEKQGYQLPLTEANIKYKKPAVYDDLLAIDAAVSELYTPKVHIDYRIFNKESGELLVEGFTDHFFIKTETKKACRPPKIYIETLEPFFNRKK
ncbi:MAG: thioesterase family protein [Ignavibacteria bacterium]|jgi:acyl-CoA thioester hydrolase